MSTDFHYDADDCQINPQTYEVALLYFKMLRERGVHWKAMGNVKKAVAKIQWMLDNLQETNLLDVEDVLLEIVMRVDRHGAIRKFEEMVHDAISRAGSSVREPGSPVFIELLGHMNDDDLQASDNSEDLKVDNDMSAVCSPDCGPGSDMHIACIDIEEQLGGRTLDVFECRLTGAKRTEISEAFGLSYDQVRYSEETAARFLERGEYTLDGTNRRLGSAKEFEAGRTFFPAERHTVRTWEVPDVDHRSTKYADIPEIDYSPIAPTGDEVQPHKHTWSTVGGQTVVVQDKRSSYINPNANPQDSDPVKTVSFDEYPKGHDENRHRYSQFGNPADWKPYADTAYGVSIFNTSSLVEKLQVPRDKDMEKVEKWEAAEARKASK